MADTPKIILTADGERPLESDLYSAEQQGADAENIAATGHLNIGTVIDYDALAERRQGGSASPTAHSQLADTALAQDHPFVAPPTSRNTPDPATTPANYSQHNSSYANPGFTYNETAPQGGNQVTTTGQTPGFAGNQVAVNGADGTNGTNGTSTFFSTQENPGDGNTYIQNNTTNNNTTYNINQNYTQNNTYNDNHVYAPHNGINIGDVTIGDINIGIPGGGGSPLIVIDNVLNNNTVISSTVDNVLNNVLNIGGGGDGDGGNLLDPLAAIVHDVTTLVDNTITNLPDTLGGITQVVDNNLLQPVLNTIEGTLQPVITTVDGALQPVLNTVEGTLHPVLNTVAGSLLQPVANLAEGALAPVLPTVTTVLDQALHSPAELPGTVINTVTNTVGGVVNEAEGLLGGLGGGLPGLPDASSLVGDVVSEVENVLGGGGLPELPGIPGLPGLPDAGTAVDSVIHTVADIGAGATQGVAETIGNIFAQAQAVGSSVIDSIAQAPDGLGGITNNVQQEAAALITNPVDTLGHVDQFLSGVTDTPQLADVLAQINNLLGDAPQPVDIAVPQILNIGGGDNNLADAAAPLLGNLSTPATDNDLIDISAPILGNDAQVTGQDNDLIDINLPVLGHESSVSGQDNDFIQLDVLTPGSSIANASQTSNDVIHVDASVLPSLSGASNDLLVVGLDTQLGIEPINIAVPADVTQVTSILSNLADASQVIDTSSLSNAVSSTANTILSAPVTLPETLAAASSTVDNQLAMLTSPVAGGTPVDTGHLASTVDTAVTDTTAAVSAAATALPAPTVVTSTLSHLGGLLGGHH